MVGWESGLVDYSAACLVLYNSVAELLCLTDPLRCRAQPSPSSESGCPGAKTSPWSTNDVRFTRHTSHRTRHFRQKDEHLQLVVLALWTSVTIQAMDNICSCSMKMLDVEMGIIYLSAQTSCKSTRASSSAKIRTLVICSVCGLQWQFKRRIFHAQTQKQTHTKTHTLKHTHKHTHKHKHTYTEAQLFFFFFFYFYQISLSWVKGQFVNYALSRKMWVNVSWVK